MKRGWGYFAALIFVILLAQSLSVHGITRRIAPTENSFDVQPLDIKFNPDPPTAGQSTTITVDWINNGPDTISTPLNYWKTKVYVDGNEIWWWSYGANWPAGVTYSDSFSYTFPSAGTKQVKVIVDVNNNLAETNEGNNQRIENINVQSAPPQNHAPIADVGPNQETCVGNPLYYSGYYTSDPDGDPLTYNWNFGDGSSASGYQVSHAYSAVGTYTVTLTATDDKGASGTDTALAYINASCGNQSNNPPTATFSYTPSSPKVNEAVQFSDNSYDSDGTIASRFWNFGDGTTSTLINPTKTYSAAGNYSVSLTVTDNDGASSTAQRTITVTTPPVSDTTPPIVSVAHIPNNPVIIGSLITIAANAYDYGGLSRIEIYYDNSLKKTCTTSNQFSTCSYSTTYNGETHSYHAKAYDKSNNVQTSNKKAVAPEWAPYWWSSLREVYRDNNFVTYYQEFKFNKESIDYLRSKNLGYQWELRRPDSPNAWDAIWGKPGFPPQCMNYGVSTNLPNPDTSTTEESNWIQGCFAPFRDRNNEEFEIASRNPSLLEPEKLYYVSVRFKRIIKNERISITSESEYCGNNAPWCSWGKQFGFFEMSEKSVLS